MDHEWFTRSVDDDDLEQIAGPVTPGEQESRRVVTELDPDDGVVVGVGDVFVGDSVTPGRRVNLHTE